MGMYTTHECRLVLRDDTPEEVRTWICSIIDRTDPSATIQICFRSSIPEFEYSGDSRYEHPTLLVNGCIKNYWDDIELFFKKITKYVVSGDAIVQYEENYSPEMYAFEDGNMFKVHSNEKRWFGW